LGKKVGQKRKLAGQRFDTVESIGHRVTEHVLGTPSKCSFLDVLAAQIGTANKCNMMNGRD
jgi:hypothetical protein